MKYLESKLYILKSDNIIRYKSCEYKNGSENITKFIFRIIKKNKTKYIWNEDGTIDAKSKDVCKIRLIVHTHSDFLTGYPTGAPDVNCFGQDDKNYYPTLHISLSNLYVESLYYEAPLPASVPRSFQIMDNSIWNYLIPLSGIINRNSELKFHILFEDAVASIYKTFKKHLYDLEVAKEYANLNARLAGEAFLSGSHAKGVSPFVFHSESAIKKMIEEEFENPGRNTLKKILKRKWRILLVDDKATIKMEPKGLFSDESTVGGLPWNCKLRIIEDLLKKKFGEEYIGHIIDSNTRIYIDYAQTIDDAEKALKCKKFDIVLMDYLLDKKNGKQNYGYEILDHVYKQIEKAKNEDDNNYDKIDFKIGPKNRLFFMFISAYSSAVYERLLAEGLNQSEDYWHISIGACPTNTPQLFLYSLIKIMEKRLDDSHINDLSPKGIVETVAGIFAAQSPRQKASDSFQDIQNLQYHYRSILKDVEIMPKSKSVFETSGSVLMTDFIQNHIQLGALLEHLAQLVHITAFGTVRQWSEMWEEFLYFRSQLEKLLFYNIDIQNRQEGNGEENEELLRKYEKMCVDVENYIRKMKTSVI